MWRNTTPKGLKLKKFIEGPDGTPIYDSSYVGEDAWDDDPEPPQDNVKEIIGNDVRLNKEQKKVLREDLGVPVYAPDPPLTTMLALQQVGGSSSSEGDHKYLTMDEKKRKRMISNRESARRSRMRKQKLVEDLRNEASQLQDDNNGIVSKIDSTTEMYMACAAENNELRAQAMELTERLRSLNHVILNSGLSVDIPDLPLHLLRPWQLPCPSQPIMASLDFFQF